MINITRRFIVPSFLLLLTLALTTVIVFYLRPWIELPVREFLAILRSIFSLVPQVFVWALLISLFIFTAISTLLREKSQKREEKPLSRTHGSRISKWEQLLEESSEGPYFEWRLSTALRDLTLEIVAFSNKLSIEETRIKIVRGELPLPNELTDLMQHSLEERSLKFSMTDANPDRELDHERYISYLEGRLEGQSDS